MFAFAPTPAPGTAPDPKAQALQMLGTFLFMGIIMYLLVFRPQRKKAKEQADLLKELRAKDKVVTAAGLVGEVVSVKERTVTIRCGDTKLEVLKSSITEVTEKGGNTSDN